MKPKRYKLFRGLATLCAFLCAFMIGLNMIASVSEYKTLINDFIGKRESSSVNADAYAYTSDYNSTTALLTRRKEIAEQIGEEGCVLLKNEHSALPLEKKSGGENLKVTVLGSRAYTYDANGNLRESREPTKEEKDQGRKKVDALSFYGGIVGSPIRRQTVTVSADGKDVTVSLPITVQDAFKNYGIEINPNMVNFYSNKPFPQPVAGSEANGSAGGPFSIEETRVSLSDCAGYQNYSDACFVVIGRTSGEGREYLPGANGIKDRADGSKSALGLSDDERNLIEVASQISEKVIVLINSAVAMEIDELKYNDKVDSVLWIGLPGSYGMNGVAKVISGEASPSGKLSDTYAVDASASPAAQNLGLDSQDGSGSFVWSNGGSNYNSASDSHYVVLAEDIYTGYYYYETRYADCVEGNGNASAAVGIGYGEKDSQSWNYQKEVAYPFGYGLSYTQFTQEIVADSLTANYGDKTVSLDVKVKNVGDRAGKEVVELYVQSPYTDYDKSHGIEKSAIQLIQFEKVSLEAGEETTVTLTADMKYFASYDKTASHAGVTGGYILEQGDYYFAVGNGAHSALNNVLLKKGVDEAALYCEIPADEDCAVKWTPDGLSFDADGVDSALLSETANGTTVKNRLQDADYNYFVNDTVTYLSRSDWEGTFPKAYTGLAVTEKMYDFLDSKVYKFTTGPSDTSFGVDHSEEEDEDGNPGENLSVAHMKMAAYDDERWSYLVEEITFDEAWAFSPYGGTSCNMFLSVNAPEVWQIDGPNGNVTRGIGAKAASSGPLAVHNGDPNFDYMSADMCCEPMTAATFNKELLKEQGEIYGENMLWSGNAIIWAPGMNLHRTPFNSRNHEYYSEDAMLTNIMGVAFVEGGLAKGAILAAKHFAFNTQESFREGLCQFMEEQSAREMELRAFQGLSEDAVFVNALDNKIGALGLMTSFSRIGVCGVNAHTGLMKEILRGEWGYKGLSSTDMVVMGQFFNPQDSIINNVTFMATSNAENLLNNFWPDYNNKNKVKSDPALCKALSENMHYYMYAIANSSALNGIDASMTIGETIYGWQYAIMVMIGVFAAAAAAMAGLCIAVKVKERKNSGDGGSPTDGTPVVGGAPEVAGGSAEGTESAPDGADGAAESKADGANGAAEESAAEGGGV